MAAFPQRAPWGKAPGAGGTDHHGANGGAIVVDGNGIARRRGAAQGWTVIVGGLSVSEWPGARADVIGDRAEGRCVRCCQIDGDGGGRREPARGTIKGCRDRVIVLAVG
ncbi:hypothetical protein D3C76_1256570 [compost metagenome]